MLTKPFLAKCSDRSSLPKSHPITGSPESWFSDEALYPYNLSGITFDFFINWSSAPNSITPVIWIKRIVHTECNLQQVIENLANTLMKEFGETQLNKLRLFGCDNGLAVQFILFKDDLDWANRADDILMVDLVCNKEDQVTFTHSIVSIECFKTIIRTHSGGPIQIGSKGLMYGTSNLECHLSATNSLYPGDVDLIILDSAGKPLCLLEFKKHNLNSSISLQKLSNYYPDPDGRKYNRLAILRDYLSEKTPNIPMFVIYYPTNPAFTEGRLELLAGELSHLTTKAASNFLLPAGHSKSEYNKIIEKLLRAIEWHYSQK